MNDPTRIRVDNRVRGNGIGPHAKDYVGKKERRENIALALEIGLKMKWAPELDYLDENERLAIGE